MTPRTVVNAILSGPALSILVRSRRGRRMVLGETQTAASRHAAVALPILMFPVMVAAVIALAAPQSGYGLLALVIGTIAVAWYVLGGVISLTYVLDRLAARPRPEKLALLVGAEGDGLSSRWIEQADVVVRIPMRRAVDSLNVAAATAVACWTLA